MNQTTKPRTVEQVSPRAAMCAAIDENAAILGSYLPAHVTPARFIALATRAVLDNADLWGCSSASVLKALAAAAASGLPIDGRMSSLIVRKSKSGKPTATWDPSYRGMVFLCLESGHVSSVEAFAVFQRDEFSVELGSNPTITHRPHLGDARGAVVAAYAVATLKLGGLVREVLGAEDLRKIKAASPAGDKGAWSSWPDRMAMKSALRRLLKKLPAADIGTAERARQHVIEHADSDGAGAYQASTDAPTRRTAEPQDTTALEARALTAINESGRGEDLAQAWNGIRAEFRELDIDVPLAIEARYHTRREALQE
jgi:recombination protein RecT